jgi:hypothetical protein
MFSCSDVDMLTTCAIVNGNAINCQEFITANRPLWTMEYFNAQKLRIEQAFVSTLGANSVTDQRQATEALAEVKAEAVTLLSQIKICIRTDFKKDPARRDEILRLLGFMSNEDAISKGKQADVIELLHTFCLMLSESLRAELVDKGMHPDKLDAVTAITPELLKASLVRESCKGNRAAVTSASVEELNEIYSDTISICSVNHNLYKGKPLMQDLFNFSKIRNRVSSRSAAKKETTAPTINTATESKETA